MLLLGSGLVAGAAAPSGPSLSWDFESDDSGWRHRAEGITLSGGDPAPEAAGSRRGLRIRGAIGTGWNYAVSGERPLEEMRLYRLSAWVRVDRLGEKTPLPYLKCEFLPESGRGTLGRASTERYRGTDAEGSRMGRWQHLVGEFEAPAGAGRCWVALEKGTSSACEIDATIDDVRIEPIARLSVIEQYRLDPVPGSLAARGEVHPRLFLDPDGLRELRRSVGSTHAALWEEIRERVDQAVERGPPAYRRHDSYSGDEQLWQRNVGNALPYIAMAYVVTGEARYLASASEWAVASCGYETWGLGRTDGMDLAAGHQLFGLGVVYDWCHDALDDDVRDTIRATLVKRASAMFEAAATAKVWWSRSYLQNHLWVNACGLAAAGFALFGQEDDALLWIGLALEKFRRTVESLGPDGASHEGVGYWQYGAEYLLKFLWLARDLLDVDLLDHPWWRNTAAYALHLSLPRSSWTRRSCIVDLADCPRGNWYGPDHILRCLARLNRDARAQWLAREVDAAGVEAHSAGWLNLLWYDPTVTARHPHGLPTLRHFEDMGIVAARSDWSGGESLVVFKCGPFLGHHAVQAFDYDPGGGHVHPDANHFVLFAEGEWLIRDDGYRAKWSHQHNTLLVDGRGQLGEGSMWFRGVEALRAGARPRIVTAASREGLVHITGDASSAYPRELGLERYRRHLLFLEPDVLIVVDDVLVDSDRALEVRFHPEATTPQKVDAAYRYRGEQSVLRIEPLTPDGVTISAEDLAAAGRHGEDDSRLHTVRLRCRQREWKNAVALSWAPQGGTPPEVTLTVEDGVWTFRTRERSVELDLRAGTREGGVRPDRQK